MVNALNPAHEARGTKNKNDYRESPGKNRHLLPWLVEIGAGKVIDESGEENARPEDDIAIDRQLVNMAVPYHGQKDADIPHSADKEKTGKKVVIFLSAP
jgi:hypothetical protein